LCPDTPRVFSSWHEVTQSMVNARLTKAKPHHLVR
jgi:hypothetical protein